MDLKNVLNIAYLGPESSFSEMARDVFCKKYGINTFSTSLKTINDVVDFVDKNPYTLGVVPIENSIEGSMRAVFDSLIGAKNPNIRILSEVVLPIEYCLLSRTTEFYSITGIIATPYLLGKCQEFIKHEMPMNLNIIEQTSMSECARNLANYNLTYGSIGNRKTAEIYRLNILKENINDDKTNKTKYVLIGDFDTPVTGSDKTSIAFAINNTPGALLEVLKTFLENDINLSYIASHQSKDNMDEYYTCVTFDGHINDGKLDKVFDEIKPKTQMLKFLGSYERIMVD